MPINAILFDLDGTLLDTLDDLADAANRVLAAGRAADTRTQRLSPFIGDGSRMLVTRAIPEDHRTPERIEDLLTRFKDDYSRHWKTATRPYPGIHDLLRELVRRGIPPGGRDEQTACFRRRLCAPFFPGYRLPDDLGPARRCPSQTPPIAGSRSARQLRVPAPECLLLGDSDVDMQTARAAGMLPVGAAWGFRPVGELIAAGAVRIVHSPQEILECIDGPPSQ
jgi:phosphoglycolate phosphatase